MAKSDNLTDFLTDVADAIRAKKGTTEKINPQDFASEIASIEGGGGKRQRVMYLRRTNVGYINTGVQGANSNLTIEIRYAMRTFPPGYWSIIYAYLGESYNATRILMNKNTTLLGTLNSLASSSLSITRTGYTNVIYTDILSPASGTTFKLSTNGVSSTKTRSAGTALNGEITIFPVKEDTVDIELYHVKILDGSTLVRDFIPDYQNGKFGLWDTVTEKFYGNDGDGEFSGEIVTIE